MYFGRLTHFQTADVGSAAAQAGLPQNAQEAILGSSVYISICPPGEKRWEWRVQAIDPLPVAVTTSSTRTTMTRGFEKCPRARGCWWLRRDVTCSGHPPKALLLGLRSSRLFLPPSKHWQGCNYMLLLDAVILMRLERNIMRFFKLSNLKSHPSGAW